MTDVIKEYRMQDYRFPRTVLNYTELQEIGILEDHE